MGCVDLARLSASGSNAQPLKYVLSNDRATNAKIFSTLSWAGYLQDWPGPSEGERPSAYIVILLDKQLKKDPGCDHGIAALCILLVVALGKPKETVKLETVGPDGDTKYWRDENGVHHVPKRLLEDVIVELEGD